MTGRKFLYGVLAVLVIASAGIVWYYRWHAAGGSIKFAVAQTGTIHHEHTLMASFANQEVLLTAPFAGQVQFTCADGERVRRGETVANLNREGYWQSQDIRAEAVGLFFRQTDGLETVFTIGNLEYMDWNELLRWHAGERQAETDEHSGEDQQTQEDIQAEDFVYAGEFVGKIVNNLIPSQAFLELPDARELPDVEALTAGRTIRLTVGQETLSARVLRASEEALGVVVVFPHYIDGSATQRRQEVSWIYRTPTSGVLVPKSAVWDQGEEQGVFLWSEGVIHFKRVNILDQNEEYVCIENLNSGVPVVTTPREGLEGLVADVKNI